MITLASNKFVVVVAVMIVVMVIVVMVVGLRGWW